MAESTPGTTASAVVPTESAATGPVTAPAADPNAVYALGSSRGESARLERQWPSAFRKIHAYQRKGRL